jgi:choline dehydrogenase-like flavoprotein
MSKQPYDVCIVGSGAGASGVAYMLSQAGLSVVILEKGDFYKEKDFSKDEIAFCRRDIVTPSLRDEYHTIENFEDGKWVKTPTYESGNSFFNGSLVGGSSNFMSGYFHRMKPDDFSLRSRYGVIEGANVVDWPITYADMEPYYEKVERIVGVSGEVMRYPFLEPRSSDNFPYPPLAEHPVSALIDKSSKALGFSSIKTPRAILSQSHKERSSCYYSNYCGSYGCSSGAKGSARAALLMPAIKSGNLSIIAGAHVTRLISKGKRVIGADYIDSSEQKKQIKAKLFIVAAQAIESARLLLNSKSSYFKKGLANNNNQVGKNLIFSAGGVGSGLLDSSVMPLTQLLQEGVFVNRTLYDWYFTKRFKGGIIDFLFEHANPIPKASRLRWREGRLIWGQELQESLYRYFRESRKLNFEIFNDWLPTDNCFVSVDERYRDKYGMPVANIRIGAHPQDIRVGEFLAQKGEQVLRQMGAKEVSSSVGSYPPPNLQAGGCRFGDNAKESVLDRDCKAHEVENLFVTDGSFMPTGGSVPYTWTIYANSFRVADHILEKRAKFFH